jgi:hypothetical protein
VKALFESSLEQVFCTFHSKKEAGKSQLIKSEMKENKSEKKRQELYEFGRSLKG